MNIDRDSMACVYGPPETFFHKKEEAEKHLKGIGNTDLEPRKSISVVAAVIVKGNEILAAERGYGNWKGWWEFPGGKIEDNETPEEALQREIREEMDADVNIVRYYRTIEYDYPEFHMTMSLYLCTLPSGRYTLKEHSDARFLSQDQLSSVKWLPADIELIKEWEQKMVTL